MNLYLVQHAEAKSKDEDPERSLAIKGYTNIKKTALFISKQTGIKVNYIYQSGKKRARQTAEVLESYLNPIRGVDEVEGLEPNADPSIWVERISTLKEDIMLVGHLPHLVKLASLLLCEDENKTVVDFQNAGIVCLTKGESGSWSVRWIIVPSMLE